MLADARLIAHKPKNLTMEAAAALPLVALQLGNLYLIVQILNLVKIFSFMELLVA